ESGPSHHRQFDTEVLIGDKVIGVGHGLSKKESEQQASKMALESLSQEGYVMVFLRHIVAHGCKSFAVIVNIKFNSGGTAVVGPNGSGKSNITDAMRWVLGEQSARVMRGAKMEDIIFDGTDNRQSMGSASVSLILDNTDKVLGEKDEVIITRKLYRNGDSEYFINNEKSKLRDITELFMDSGLGKNAYNIISQGQVDEILKAKPLERRKLIEEAAGVMKY